jgi:hypothetical protein
LQLQYLSINLSNNTIYFHVLPPVGIEFALTGSIARRHTDMDRILTATSTTIQNELTSSK